MTIPPFRAGNFVQKSLARYLSFANFTARGTGEPVILYFVDTFRTDRLKADLSQNMFHMRPSLYLTPFINPF
jgi:hypothetical protein